MEIKRPLSDLIVKPDGPVRGFCQGFFATAISVGVPLIVTVLVRSGLKGLGTGILIGAVLSAAGGVCLALWRLAQGYAYNKLTTSD